MTAKTILMQLHHKIGTFESLGKHIVLVMQDALLQYMMREFSFEHIGAAKLGHALHFHAYAFKLRDGNLRKLQLASRHSTDRAGCQER